MQLHEYQAKNILKKWGIPCPPYFVVSSLTEVRKLIEKEALDEAVIKVQVHAGGRGKAGGVRFAHTPEEILQVTKELIGMKIVNAQTGPDGVIAHAVLLTQPIEIAKEYYVGIAIDRKRAQVSLIISREGGIEIEEVAEKSPEKILVMPLRKESPLSDSEMDRVLQFLGLEKEAGALIIAPLIEAFFKCDAELLELNPLVETKEGVLLALDAKLTIDDNALFRHPDLAALFDAEQISEIEREALLHELAFVPLKGTIGCMVNGAGLAMATMDLISLKGGKPANFLDVGGSATEEKVVAGFKLLLRDPQVKAILINIFGGIMDCQIIARALQRVQELGEIHLPVVVRMEGTNAAPAKEILSTLKMNILTTDSFDEAAEKVVACLS